MDGRDNERKIPGYRGTEETNTSDRGIPGGQKMHMLNLRGCRGKNGARIWGYKDADGAQGILRMKHGATRGHKRQTQRIHAPISSRKTKTQRFRKT